MMFSDLVSVAVQLNAWQTISREIKSKTYEAYQKCLANEQTKVHGKSGKIVFSHEIE